MDPRTYFPRWNPQLSDEYPDETILWRYFSIEKFLKLFSQGGIYLRKQSLLDDPFEGIPIGKQFTKRMEDFAIYPQTRAVESVKSSIIAFRDRIYVNCWNQKKDESYLLWSVYSSLDTGVAVKTTYKNIKMFFSEFLDDVPLFFGQVNYGETLFEKSDWSLPFTKTHIYSEESEFRIVYQPTVNTDSGVIIKGNIAELADQIYLAPRMTTEIENMLRSEITRNGIPVDKICKSSMLPAVKPADLF